MRVVGAAIIVVGLLVIGGEAIATIGAHGLLGDLTFALAGTVLRDLRHAAAAVADSADARHRGDQRGVARLRPALWVLFGFGTIIEVGLRENLLQALVQGILAGPAAIYLFTRSVVLLGAAAPRCSRRWCPASRC